MSTRSHAAGAAAARKTAADASTSGRFRRGVAAASIAVTFLALTRLSWLRWPELFMDFGREVYAPWQILGGKVLFRDIAYFYGCLSPYFNAALFAVFGASIRVLAMSNLALLVACTAAVFAVVRPLASLSTATLATVFFLAVFGFGYDLSLGNYNFLCPYSHQMTHGFILSLLALLLLRRTLGRHAVPRTFHVGILVGLVFLTKAELFVACAVAVCGALAAAQWMRRRYERGWWRAWGTFAAGCALPPVAADALFATALPPRDATLAVMGGWPAIFGSRVSQLPFFRSGLGLQDLGLNTVRMAAWAALYLTFFASVWGIGFVARRRHWPAGIAIVFSAVFSAAALTTVLLPRLWIGVARPLPLALAALVALALTDIASDHHPEEARRGALGGLALGLFGLGSVGKIMFTSYLGHYGFVLAAPGTVLVVIVLLERLPGWAERHGSHAAVVRTAVLTLIGFVAMTHVVVSARGWAEKISPAGHGADTVLTDARNAAVAQAISRIIASQVGPRETLAVLPDGILLNYLGRRVNPTRFMAVTPVDIAIFGEGNIVAAYRRHPPDVVLALTRGGPGAPPEQFGTGFGGSLMAWIRESYSSVGVVQLGDAEHGTDSVLVLRRAPVPAAATVPPG